MSMITTVELQEGKMPSGDPFSQFFVVYEDGQEFFVPITEDIVLNRYYWEIREWYLNQPKRPFAFAFDPLPMEGQ